MGYEVDVVIESGTRLLPIEVKTTSQPSPGDLGSMRAFVEEYGDQVVGGLLLHGEDTFWIAERVLAAPWWRVV